MTVCAECGGPVDPDVTHMRHDPDCDPDDSYCLCDEVCAACCTDPDCPLRQPQEINMTDRTPRDRWGTCCPYDPECEHSFLEDDALARWMDTPITDAVADEIDGPPETAMSDLRWTVDEDGICFGDYCLSLNEVHDYGTRKAAYDALVAAVRDAARIPELEAERDAAREELAEKWELYQACTGRDFYAELTPRINKLYMALNAKSRGDENDFDGDPAEPWNRLVELVAYSLLRLIVAQRWAVNEHQRCERVEAELAVLLSPSAPDSGEETG